MAKKKKEAQKPQPTEGATKKKKTSKKVKAEQDQEIIAKAEAGQEIRPKG